MISYLEKRKRNSNFSVLKSVIFLTWKVHLQMMMLIISSRMEYFMAILISGLFSGFTKYSAGSRVPRSKRNNK
jgi:hypothetical protein